MVSQSEQTMLAIMIAAIMLGMGCSLTPRDFIRAFKKPQGILVGFVSQYGIMPLLAFSMAVAFNLKPEWAIGLIIMGSMPGGSTSNIFTYFSKGDLALSVTMTTFSTLAAVVMTPLMLVLYGSRFMTEEISVGFGNVVQGLVVMLIPVLIGMFIRSKNANVGAVLELIGGVLGILIILILIATWVPRNWNYLMTTPWQVYFGAIGIGFFGMVFGFFASSAFRVGFKRAATVALETGIQNGPLAITIVLLSFSGLLADEIVLIPALYSLFIVITASFVTLFLRHQNNLREQHLKQLL